MKALFLADLSMNGCKLSSERKSGSRIVLALDFPYRKETDELLEDSIGLLEEVSDFVCAVKINFHLIIPLSIAELSKLNNLIHSKDLVSIADIKLNDIANTNEVAVNYLWDSGFDAVIAESFRGAEWWSGCCLRNCKSPRQGGHYTRVHESSGGRRGLRTGDEERFDAF